MSGSGDDSCHLNVCLPYAPAQLCLTANAGILPVDHTVVTRDTQYPFLLLPNVCTPI